MQKGAPESQGLRNVASYRHFWVEKQNMIRKGGLQNNLRLMLKDRMVEQVKMFVKLREFATCFIHFWCGDIYFGRSKQKIRAIENVTRFAVFERKNHYLALKDSKQKLSGIHHLIFETILWVKMTQERILQVSFKSDMYSKIFGEKFGKIK